MQRGVLVVLKTFSVNVSSDVSRHGRDAVVDVLRFSSLWQYRFTVFDTYTHTHTHTHLQSIFSL
jgi:hypothetical protein